MISGSVRPAIGRMIQRLSPRTVTASEITAVAVAIEPPAEVQEITLCLPAPDPEPVITNEREHESQEERAQFEAVMTRMMEENENLRERLRRSERCARQLAEGSTEAGRLGGEIGDITERISIAVLNLSIHVSRTQGAQTGEAGRRLLSTSEELARLCEHANQSAQRLTQWSTGIEPLAAEALVVAEGIGIC